MGLLARSVSPKQGRIGAVSDPADDDELRNGPSLSADGEFLRGPASAAKGLEQRLEKMEPAAAPSAAAPPSEELELAERPRPVVEERIENFRPEDPGPFRARSKALTLSLVCLLVGAGGLTALLALKPKLNFNWGQPRDGVHESTLLERLAAVGEGHPLIINSTPPGADIIIDGQPIGQTPWAGDNRWDSEAPVVLRLPGYKPWMGKVKGGQPQALDIELKR